MGFILIVYREDNMPASDKDKDKDKDVEYYNKRVQQNLRDSVQKLKDEEVAAASKAADETRLARRRSKKEKKESENQEIWSDYVKRCEEHYQRGQQGYDTWIAAMMNIVAQCLRRAEAWGTIDPLGTLFRLVSEPIVDALSQGPTKYTGEIKLPQLQHYVEFSSDDKLDVSSITKNLCRSDKQEFDAKEKDSLKQMMTLGMKIWLESHDYVPESKDSLSFVIREHFAQNFL